MFLSLQFQCNFVGFEAKVAKGKVATCETGLTLEFQVLVDAPAVLKVILVWSKSQNGM